jgi:hypothetical protein
MPGKGCQTSRFHVIFDGAEIISVGRMLIVFDCVRP